MYVNYSLGIFRNKVLTVLGNLQGSKAMLIHGTRTVPELAVLTLFAGTRL